MACGEPGGLSPARQTLHHAASQARGIEVTVVVSGRTEVNVWSSGKEQRGLWVTASRTSLPGSDSHLLSLGARPVLTVQVGKLRLRGTCPQLPGSNLGPSLRQGLRSL